MGFIVEIIFKLIIKNNVEMRPTNTIYTPLP